VIQDLLKNRAKRCKFRANLFKKIRKNPKFSKFRLKLVFANTYTKNLRENKGLTSLFTRLPLRILSTFFILTLLFIKDLRQKIPPKISQKSKKTP
jgi:hypothetical protein